jgi:hypothetical protein
VRKSSIGMLTDGAPSSFELSPRGKFVSGTLLSEGTLPKVLHLTLIYVVFWRKETFLRCICFILYNFLYVP